MSQGQPSPYRQRREGVTWYVCPQCTDQEFLELYQLKRHMEKEHGGFTQAEVSDAAQAAAGSGTEGAERQPPAPRKVSRKSRELNEKLNEAISLIVHRIMHGLNEEQHGRLAQLKGELLVNSLGFDFDFDKGLIPLQSKFWLVAFLVLTQIETAIPDSIGSQIVAIIKARKQAKESKGESDANT